MDNNFSSGISYDEFLNSVSVFCIPLVADSLSRQHTTLSPVGRAEISLTFKQPVKERLFCYICGLYGESVMLSNEQQVSSTYIPGNW